MKIGAITAGQSPRIDIIPDIKAILGKDANIVERGALDGLSRETIESFKSEANDFILTSRLNDGTSVKFPESKIIPLIQRKIDELEQENVDLIMLLCTGEFPEFRSSKILLRPGIILTNFVKSVLSRGKLAYIVPLQEQVSSSKNKWTFEGVESIGFHVSPYSGAKVDFLECSKRVKAVNPDLVILDCMGFNLEMKNFFNKATGKPVVLPRTVLARTTAELFSYGR
jgi:protein AroM